MSDAQTYLAGLHPYDTFSEQELADMVSQLEMRQFAAGEVIYKFASKLEGLYIICEGEVRVTISDADDTELSRLRRGNSFGERGLLRDGRAATQATALLDSVICLLPAALFKKLFKTNPHFKNFFQRGDARPVRPDHHRLATVSVASIMSNCPQVCRRDTLAQDAAMQMAEARITALCVTDKEKLLGIVTVRDLVSKLLAKGRTPLTPVHELMTADPINLPSSALGTDVLALMYENGFSHVPIVERGQLIGMVTQTDLTRHQALTSAWLVGDIAEAKDAEEIAEATANIPDLLVQLVAAGHRHDVVTRLITDVADAATRRLLALAEAQLGPPPVPYLWLACGSQGRQEQTGVSDQDNCMIIDDAAAEADLQYFTQLSQLVCDGLNTAGYIYCPGDMMASNSRWRQPLKVWRQYFSQWISTPDPEAQMLASVMFDLRPIGGTESLFDQLQGNTLEEASRNSIFVAHMVRNSLTHRPPLGVFGGLSMNRTGENKNAINMKHAGVVPVVDLARLYSLIGQIKPVNTRRRLELAGEKKSASTEGSRDLLDAYDLLATHRLEHQAKQITEGAKPDHYLKPASLSGFDRSHLRDAFVVVRTMQSAIGSSRAGGVL